MPSGFLLSTDLTGTEHTEDPDQATVLKKILAAITHIPSYSIDPLRPF